MALTKNIYALPFKKRDLIKAVSDPRAHFAHFKHAIDFILSEGTKILAAKSGIVVVIKVDSKEGGADPKYNDIKYLNYIFEIPYKMTWATKYLSLEFIPRKDILDLGWEEIISSKNNIIVYEDIANVLAIL